MLEKLGWPTAIFDELELEAMPLRCDATPAETAACVASQPPSEPAKDLSVDTDATSKADGPAWEYSLSDIDGGVVLSISLPEDVEPGDLDLDVAANNVKATCSKMVPLHVNLPKPVNPDSAPPAKY